MVNKIDPLGTHFPWAELLAFTKRHRDVFAPNTSTKFDMVVQEGSEDDTVDCNVQIAFVTPCDNNVPKIIGSTYSGGVVTNLVLDIEGKKGEIQLPQFHALVDLLENKCSFYTTPNAHPDIKQFAEDYVRVYWRVLNHVLKEDEVIKETMDNILLASYPERYN